jgi:methylated-DNA-protein-cysteine methyltransferase related protein
MNTNAQKVYALLTTIPRGKVMTYGQIAQLLNIPSARLVGQILHRNKHPDSIPCYKVVFANGALSSGYNNGGVTQQKKLLQADGVVFINDTVDLKRCRYVPDIRSIG